ncbi:MAG: alpha/beta hydrolase [Mariniblastus sp.]|nr:alpha/beta hydrolase [Mariniblastus sp.]
MKSKDLKFVAHRTKGKVSALLQVPKMSDVIVVLGHGAGAGMSHANMDGIANALHANRIATFRYQFPFMERGGGRDSLEVSLATIGNAVAQAQQLEPKLRLLAGGHSFGGRMTSLAAAELKLSVEGLVFFAFPLHPPGKRSAKRADHLPSIEIPMLFLTGTRDRLFDLELFDPVRKKLGRRAELHLIETADHGYKILKRTRKSKESVFDEMARVTRHWVDGV